MENGTYENNKAVTAKTKKVTMELTLQDIINADDLHRKFGTRSKTATVSAALSITRTIMDAISNGGKLQIKNKDGSTSEIVIVGVHGG